LVASALISSRDGTMEAHADPAPPAAGMLGDVAALRRWDPWVRMALGLTEATQRLECPELGGDASGDTYSVRVREWAGDADLVTLTRPDPDFFAAQLPFVQSWAELRDERALEVLAQIDNQYAFIAAASGLNVDRHRHTVEWLTVCIQLTIVVESMFKHVFACHRPVEFSPQVQPIITTPGHSSYPMGHAAQAFATAVALAGLRQLPKESPRWSQLMLQSRRISINRTIAGVHFPIDAAAGQVLGESLGEFFLCLSGIGDKPCNVRSFRPLGRGDDQRNDYLASASGPVFGSQPPKPGAKITPGPIVRELARMAGEEWKGL
jgi:membrane-associated phospholipid phosphatase